MLLIEYPQLLTPGLNRWFRQPNLLAAIFSHESDQQGEASKWRTVTVLGKSADRRMAAPSTATLRQFMYDWSKNNSGVPPVRVRWGDEKGQTNDSSALKAPPPPPIQELRRPEEKTSAPPTASEGGGGSQGSQTAAVVGDPGGARGAVLLPPPQPKSDTRPVAPENAANTTPTSIPSGINPPASPPGPTPKSAVAAQSKAEPKVFEDAQKAIRTEGSGLFDTRGFPLGDYANLIIERVKGNWLIPSNLRNSQGRTTVIFYIDRNGRFTNARIITSSGSSSLDLAALNAVIESNPFPPLPNGFPGDHVGAKFVFSYNERQ
ncbi:MAG TPA: energy transducer TonB [Acidobacteriota bacterium]|nr:energy transducer TonB [Acidobacteriota bacterium]